MPETITPQLIKRINELAKKQKEQGLTAEEREEQQRLRAIYLEGIRAQFKCTLDSIKIVKAEELH